MVDLHLFHGDAKVSIVNLSKVLSFYLTCPHANAIHLCRKGMGFGLYFICRIPFEFDLINKNNKNFNIKKINYFNFLKNIIL